MKNLKSKKKNDASHYRIAVSNFENLEALSISKRKKMQFEEQKKSWCHLKFKYGLHTQPFMCFNAQISKLNKNP